MKDNSPLAPLTTFGLGGPAKRLITVEREAEIVESIREIDARGEPLLIVGGGSNLVISDAGFQGSVLRLATRGRKVVDEHDRVLVTAQAGEPWDELVSTLVDDEGLAGVECLAGIPGLVGAVPMQNVGAYGQDVSETIVRLRAYDRQRHEVVTIDHASCAFAYRSSAFRGRDRHVILDVTFALAKSKQSRPIRYAELARALDIEQGETAPLSKVRTTVVALRKTKGMVIDKTMSDPDTQSAGSFFTNPILTADQLADLRTKAKDEGPIPVFPEPDGRSKVSAGWLIEHAGFKKGHASASGRVAVSSKHALALTNRGGATTEELVQFARVIRDGVRAKLGVTLENEPVFVGVQL